MTGSHHDIKDNIILERPLIGTFFYENKYEIALSNNDVAGFNNLTKYENKLFYDSEFEILDKGLNSPYVYKFESLLENIL